jgi:hypothetical protein
MGGARNTVVLRPEVSDGGVKVGARAVFLKFADEFSVRVDAQPPGTSAFTFLAPFYRSFLLPP